MPPTMLPFLYQTRTLQCLARAPLRRRFYHTTRATARRYDPTQPSPYDAIPFEGPIGGLEDKSKDSYSSTTMTPSEAEVFKSIFDDIAHGNMPRPSKARVRALEEAAKERESDPSYDAKTAGSLVEQARQARLSDFREKTLQRFPSTLRQAAETALNLYELEPNSAASGETETDQAAEDARLLLEREECERKREAEMSRLSELMRKCHTDTELWALLENEVFVLPAKLGIIEESETKMKRTRAKKTQATAAETEAKYSMDVYGPLYSQVLLQALDQFDTVFPQPSLYSFNILPKVKSIGLPSYVLGVSTAFYNRLARIHWERYGDASSALAMIEEMNSIGLQLDFKAHDLLVRIRDELHACASGAQGPFVAAMMESPPYDAALLHRLEGMEEYVRRTLMDPRAVA